MKYKLGIVGKDIAYSLSPYIHSSFGKEADIQLTYDIFDLDAGPLEFIEKFFEEGGTGLNITRPFKEIVAERYSSLGDVSINTLSLETKADPNNNTVIKGTSTDGAGLLEDLISRGINVKNKNVLLLGLDVTTFVYITLPTVPFANPIALASNTKDVDEVLECVVTFDPVKVAFVLPS